MRDALKLDVYEIPQHGSGEKHWLNIVGAAFAKGHIVTDSGTLYTCRSPDEEVAAQGTVALVTGAYVSPATSILLATLRNASSVSMAMTILSHHQDLLPYQVGLWLIGARGLEQLFDPPFDVFDPALPSSHCFVSNVSLTCDVTVNQLNPALQYHVLLGSVDDAGTSTSSHSQDTDDDYVLMKFTIGLAGQSRPDQNHPKNMRMVTFDCFYRLLQRHCLASR